MRGLGGSAQVIVWAALLVSMVKSQTVQAQSPAAADTVGSVTGIVIDTAGKPVADADVVIRGTGKGARTSANGQFRIGGVPNGPQVLQARRIGFRPIFATVAVASGEVSELEIVLASEPVALPGVNVEVKRTDVGRIGGSSFESRRRIGMGSFVTRGELQKRNISRLVDAFAHMRGVAAVYDPRNRLRLVSRRGSTSINFLCNVRLIVDGVVVSQDLIESIPVGDIEAIEAYGGPATTPVEFGGMAVVCGAVAIWTRGGG